jgi:MobA/MobL family
MVCAYHFHMKNVSRGKGHSAVAGAAYRSGMKLRDERTGELRDYSQRHDVIFSQIFTPKNAPDWTQERGELWNHAEAVEKRKDARVAKEFTAAIPHQLDEQYRNYLIADFAHELTRKGLILDVNIHQPHDHGNELNVHAHMMVTTRTIEGADFAEGKLLELDKKQTLEALRERWATMCAKQLDRMGYQTEAAQWRYGHMTLPQQREKALERGDLDYAAGCEKEPSQHHGKAALEIEARGGKSHKMMIVRQRQEEAKQLAADKRELQENEERQRYIFGMPVKGGKFAELREWARQYKEQCDREQQAQRERAEKVAGFAAAGQEMTAPTPNTSEIVQTHSEEPKKQAAEQQELSQEDEPERYLFGVQVVNDRNRKLREIEWEIKRQQRQQKTEAEQTAAKQEITQPSPKTIEETRQERAKAITAELERIREIERSRELGHQHDRGLGL